MTLIKNALLVILFVNTGIQTDAQKKAAFTSKVVYRSTTLVITQVAANSFLHTSFLQTNDFGNVPCNGLVVRNNNETIVLDTPTNDSTAEELITWITGKLHCQINAVVPTHFHNDCLGGLKAFDQHHIPSYANAKTIELARANNYAVPGNGFSDSMILKTGNKNVVVKFFGEGHTRDNVIGYFEDDHVLFGGCLIKELGASKGYLGDANVNDWPGTIEKIKQAYPQVKIVVPGHGEPGNAKLLDYTIKLFKTK